jgi:hypothetical protein
MRDHRRFALRVFRDFGVGSSRMENQIIAETNVKITNLLQFFNMKDLFEFVNKTVDASKNNGDNIDIFPAIELCVANIINRLLFNIKYTPVCCTHT